MVVRATRSLGPLSDDPSHRAGCWHSRFQEVSVALRLPSATPCHVPTTRPRHFVTETDELARALDQAADRWPELSRGQLIVRLALEGDDAARSTAHERRRRRREAIRQHRGALTGTYPPDYLAELRSEWPT